MPFEVMVSAYKRTIKIAPNEAEIIKQFALYLLLLGPDWDDEANQVLQLIV